MVNYGTLTRILQHELQIDCTNKAVIGGLEAFVSNWRTNTLKQARTDEERARIAQMADALMNYTALEPAERRRVLEEVLQSVPAPAPRAERTAARKHAESAERPPRAESAPPPPRSEAPARRPQAPPRARVEQAASLTAADLARPVTALRGISDANAKKLKRLNIVTIEDLLNFYPRRYVDYSQLKTIDQLFFGEEVTIIGTITHSKLRETRRGFNILEVTVSDDTGAVRATWFNQPWELKRLFVGRQIVLSGKVDEYLGKIVFTSPSWEPLEREQLSTNRWVPIYPLTEGVSAPALRKLIRTTLNLYTPRLNEYLPHDLRQRAGLLDLSTALNQIHFPDNEQMLQRAQRRLAFDEFLIIQLGVLRQRQRWQSVPTTPLVADEQKLQQFLNGLSFQLTGAQRRALDEIKADLAKPIAMSRLLQGDVGAGKTMVAAAAAQVAIDNGKQTAIMAPTEILAEQHFRTLTRLFASSRVGVRLLVGSMSKREKDAVKEELQGDDVHILVGTHALIQDDVAFRDLGLVVVDEQHRFGVEQRASLRQKGWNPHMLVMTATPIPRTLSLTLYGDLDVSILDELPPGRQPITTQWREPIERERTYTFVRAQVQQGRQAFVICPLVEESEKLEAKAAVDEHARLQRDIFPDLRLGLLHGRMKGKEKEETMRAFLNREYDILVSTSVVEVGIDVPNATVMLVEGANRFGLSQLHQFRGRVGRGEHASYCYLLADTTSENGAQRLKVIEQTQDGFRLAEEDLKMRGPGEFFGTRQSGLPDLKIAKLSDVKVLEDARREAQQLFAHDPGLERPEHEALAQKVRAFWRGAGDLS